MLVKWNQCSGQAGGIARNNPGPFNIHVSQAWLAQEVYDIPVISCFSPP